jgi:hypothetical protein
MDQDQAQAAQANELKAFWANMFKEHPEVLEKYVARIFEQQNDTLKLVLNNQTEIFSTAMAQQTQSFNNTLDQLRQIVENIKVQPHQAPAAQAADPGAQAFEKMYAGFAQMNVPQEQLKKSDVSLDPGFAAKLDKFTKQFKP